MRARGRAVILALVSQPGLAFARESDPDLDTQTTFTVQKAGTAQGVVYGPEGQPLAGVTVKPDTREFRLPQRLLGGLTDRAEAKTDPQGRWRFEGLIPGLEYSIEVYDRETKTHGREDFIAGGGTAALAVDIHLQ